MIDKVETIFDYILDDLETKVLNPPYNKTLYILFAPPEKILSDLHLLFLIRQDKVNSHRIMNMLDIMKYEI